MLCTWIKTKHDTYISIDRISENGNSNAATSCLVLGRHRASSAQGRSVFKTSNKRNARSKFKFDGRSKQKCLQDVAYNNCRLNRLHFQMEEASEKHKYRIATKIIKKNKKNGPSVSVPQLIWILQRHGSDPGIRKQNQNVSHENPFIYSSWYAETTKSSISSYHSHLYFSASQKASEKNRSMPTRENFANGECDQVQTSPLRHRL